MRVRCGVAAIAVAWSMALAGMVDAVAGPLEDGEAAYERGDYAGALSLWGPLAERGNPRAQNWIGLLFHSGYGLPQDDAAAARWYRRAAEQEYPVAQYNLAAEYLEGAGVPRDDAEAVKWFRKAARQGHGAAERELGTMYYHGRGGLPRNTAEAIKWWNAAANAGDAEAARLAREGSAADAATRAQAARDEAIRKARIPELIKRNNRVNSWKSWDERCFDYVAAESFAEPGPRATVNPQRSCCPGVVTIKKIVKDDDGVDALYLVAFAAGDARYCSIQFFGGWIKAAVFNEP